MYNSTRVNENNEVKKIMKKDTVSFVALGGQAENGKSMYVFEINDKIFVVDTGFKFPEQDKLGVDIIIPGFEYLKENAKRIAAIIITHGHDDVMQGLGYILDEINVPVYAPSLTADLIKVMMEHYNKRNRTHIELKLHPVSREADIKIKGVNVSFFPLTHSIPGSIGVAFETSQGYIVYTGESIIDFGAPDGFKSNLQRMMDIGNKGVLALLVESSYATRDGYTSPKHKLTNKIEPIFEDTNGRIIISAYAQNIFRIQEIIELTKKYDRKLVFYGRDAYDNTNALVNLEQHASKKVLNIPKEYLGNEEMIGDPRWDDNLVVLVTGTSRSIYHDLCDIIDGGDERLKLGSTDTIIVVSPVFPGTEKIANKAQNDLYRTNAKIHILQNKDLYSMHASIEDIKVYIQTFKPKYYLPIKGEYQHFVANSHIAKKMGIDDEHILITDNGEKITFENGERVAGIEEVPVDSIMIDGIGVGDVGVKVIDDRIMLSQDGVVIIGMTVDETTREIITATDVQTRGFIYLKDAEHIVREITAMAEKEVEKAAENNVADLTEVRNTIRDNVCHYILKQTGKRPVVLPVIIEVKN